MPVSVKRPETFVEFCQDANLKAEHEAAEAEYIRENQKRLADSRLGNTVRKKAERVQELEALMQESTVTFLIRGMKRGAWAELIANHPPREKNQIDARYGFNLEALMIPAIPQSIVKVTTTEGEPVEFDPATEWEGLADDMTDSQYEDFVMAVIKVNRGSNDIPFSLSASRMIQDSEAN